MAFLNGTILFTQEGQSYSEPVLAISPKIPIKHIVFVVQENHSFDNYFGTYTGANGITSEARIPLNPNQTSAGYASPFKLDAARPILLVGDELPPGVSNPQELTNSEISIFHIGAESTNDINHSWQAAHTSWDNGKMDGFVYAQKSSVPMGYYDR